MVGCACSSDSGTHSGRCNGLSGCIEDRSTALVLGREVTAGSNAESVCGVCGGNKHNLRGGAHGQRGTHTGHESLSRNIERWRTRLVLSGSVARRKDAESVCGVCGSNKLNLACGAHSQCGTNTLGRGRGSPRLVLPCSVAGGNDGGANTVRRGCRSPRLVLRGGADLVRLPIVSRTTTTNTRKDSQD